MSYLAKAIFKLCPSAEFSFTEEDYSTIKWDVLDQDAPTQSEIDSAIEEVKQEETQSKINASAAKDSALSKLAALGLTLDEVNAIIP